MNQSAPAHNSNEQVAVLPVVSVEKQAREIVDLLDAAAKRGKLAGFERGQSGIPLFRIRDFGGPYEAVLEAFVEQSRVTTLRFQTRLQTRLAWVYFIALVVSVWPGVWLTDSMIRSYFTGYDYKTWMWYLPLTAPAVPWAMWTTLKKSRGRAAADAAEIIATIAGLIGGRLDPPKGAEAGST